jgi:hypothetical protein
MESHLPVHAPLAFGSQVRLRLRYAVCRRLKLNHDRVKKRGYQKPTPRFPSIQFGINVYAIVEELLCIHDQQLFPLRQV